MRVLIAIGLICATSLLLLALHESREDQRFDARARGTVLHPVVK